MRSWTALLKAGSRSMALPCDLGLFLAFLPATEAFLDQPLELGDLLLGHAELHVHIELRFINFSHFLYWIRFFPYFLLDCPLPKPRLGDESLSLLFPSRCI